MKPKMIMFAVLVMCFSVYSQFSRAEKIQSKSPSEMDRAVVKGNDAFAFSLYNQLSKESGNIVVSPYSVSQVLALLYSGAGGETERQMKKVLHVTTSQTNYISGISLITNRIKTGAKKSGLELDSENALFIQTGLKIQPGFNNVAKIMMGASVQPVDYRHGSLAKIKETINTWARQQTRGKIRELIEPGMLTRTNILMVVNAEYFRGNWAAQFNPRSTVRTNFYSNENDVIPVPMMKREGWYRYSEDSRVQCLELPYKGNRIVMLVLLPKQRDGIGEMEKELKEDTVAHYVAHFSTEEVEVNLPRFSIEYSQYLKDTLSQMGMPLAFIPTKADFSGITSDTKIHLSQIIQKAGIQVDEKGTTAWAATGASMDSMPILFRADHPFMFLIWDKDTGSILFMGRVSKPNG